MFDPDPLLYNTVSPLFIINHQFLDLPLLIPCLYHASMYPGPRAWSKPRSGCTWVGGGGGGGGGGWIGLVSSQ